MPVRSLDLPVCAAHRGLKEHYPENTLASFKAALDAGAQMIELDVGLSRDRHLVVIHDETLERTTNGRGRVCDQSLAELKRLDAGTWFDSRFKAETIPTLSEVIDLVGAKAVLNIEIKKEYFEDDFPMDAIEKQVLQTINSKKVQSSAMVSSFEIRYLRRLRALDATLALAYISLEEASPSVINDCKQLNCFSWHAWHETLTPDQVDDLHAAGFKVFSFTIRKREEFDKVMTMGVDGIFADDLLFYNPLMPKREKKH